MADYADDTRIDDYMPKLTTDAKAGFKRAVTAASRAIDSYTKRAVDAFAASPEDGTEEVIYGTGEQSLDIGAFVAKSVTGVVDANGNPVSVVEHKGALRITDASGRLTGRRFEQGAPYRVTARYGYAETPADITEACLQLATRWWKGKDESFSGVIGNINRDSTIVERSYPAAVKELLAPYVLEDTAEKSDDAEIQVGSLNQSDFYAEGTFGFTGGRC